VADCGSRIRAHGLNARLTAQLDLISEIGAKQTVSFAFILSVYVWRIVWHATNKQWSNNARSGKTMSQLQMTDGADCRHTHEGMGVHGAFTSAHTSCAVTSCSC
jgi:hypothetical protein